MHSFFNQGIPHFSVESSKGKPEGRQHGQVVRASDLKSGGPMFKSHSDH